jgi:hypothetical protein
MNVVRSVLLLFVLSLICNALKKESVGSLSVTEIGGPYLCGRSRSDGHQGSLKAVCMLLDVIEPSLFGYTCSFSIYLAYVLAYLPLTNHLPAY